MKLQPECTVLLVEEDSSVREVLTTMLRDLGLAVQPADSGAEAIAIYQQHAEIIAVLLLDVGMTALDGPQTLRELQRINPGVLCCFMTGGSQQYDESALLEMGAAYVFQKPFQMSEVVGVLKQLAHGLTLDDGRCQV